MFNIGTGEIVVIAVVALLVLGPKRLPELARGIGKFMREFRRQTDEVRGVVEREFYKMDQEINKPAPAPIIQPAVGTVPNLPASPGAAVAPLDGPPPGGLATPAEAAPVGLTASAGQLPVPGVDISDPSHPDHLGPQTPAAAAAPAMDLSDPRHPDHFGPQTPGAPVSPVAPMDLSDPRHPEHFGPQTPAAAPAAAPAMDVSDPAHPEHFGPQAPSAEKKAG